MKRWFGIRLLWLLAVPMVICSVQTFLQAQQPIRASETHTALSPEQELGKRLFFDSNLSMPPVMSCSSCHSPDTGFADPRQTFPVSHGAVVFRCTNRNAPSAAYAAFSPYFHYDYTPRPGLPYGMYVGGVLWDGLAIDLVDQAKKPFLKINEMNNPNRFAVVQQVRASDYADLFRDVFGPDSLSNVNSAYDLIAAALAEYEKSSEVCQFTSKYDYYLDGKTQLTDQELRGLALFEGKGTCANCHTMSNQVNGKPLFTSFGYVNIGVPKTPDNPFYFQPPIINPAGIYFIDLGLGGRLNDPKQYGKFKIPTLRNIAKTAPYMHNGCFDTLYDVVHFDNTRDVLNWPPAEVRMNMFRPGVPGTFGQLGLTEQEELDIIAFLETLTDGYVP